MTFEAGREAVLAVLGEEFRRILGELHAESDVYFLAIADDAVRYGMAKAAGLPGAEMDLRHIEAQVKLLAAKVALREASHVEELLLQAARISGSVLGEVLRRLA